MNVDPLGLDRECSHLLVPFYEVENLLSGAEAHLDIVGNPSREFLLETNGMLEVLSIHVGRRESLEQLCVPRHTKKVSHENNRIEL